MLRSGLCALALVAALERGTTAAAETTRPSPAGPASDAREPQVQPPTVLEQAPAPYPAEALDEARGQNVAPPTGDVAVRAELDEQGHVVGVAVVRSAAPALDRAALAAASRWRFAPATRNGVPAASRVQLFFHFEPPPVTTVPTPPAATLSGGTGKADAVSSTQASPAPSSAAQSAAATSPAQSAPEPSSASPEHLDVTVLGRRKPPSRGASDFDIKVGALKEVPRANASDFLKLAPGILLTNEGGEGHAEQVFMRGFDAREGQDIEFTVGGVPINEAGNLHGNGYADTHFIIPELISGLRVVEGPFDPRQGNFAVAGSADFELGLAERGASVRTSAGSYGTRRVVGLFGPAGESPHTFGAAELSTTDGYGQNRDAQRAGVMAQYEGRLGRSSGSNDATDAANGTAANGSAGTYRFGAQLYSTHFHSAGIIREDDLRSGRIGFFDSYDLLGSTRQQMRQGGDAARASLHGDVDLRAGSATLSQQVFLIKRDMRLLENFTGFLLDVQEPLQSLHPQRGDMLDLSVHAWTLGARGASRWQTSWRELRQELELGYSARTDQVEGLQQRLEATTGVPYKTETNLASQINDLALYGDANLRLARLVSLRGGARAEMLTYDVHDRCAAQSVTRPSTSNPPIDESCLSQQNNGRPREPDQRASTSSAVLLPRASLLVGPVRDLTFSASVGRGVRSIDPSYVSQDVKTPFASVNAYEAGLAYARELAGVRVVARGVLFRTVVDRDLLFSETEGRNTLGGGTTRNGVVTALRLSGRFFDEAANLTLVRAELDDTHQSVAYIPGTVLRSDTSLFSPVPAAWLGGGRLSFNLGVTFVGPRPLPYGQHSDALFTADGALAVSWPAVEVRLSATNLRNTRDRLGQYNFASDFRSQAQPTLVPEREFTAGPPRMWLLTLALKWGGV